MKHGFTPLETKGRRKKSLMSMAGFTLVEIIAVLAIIGIGISLFYTVLYVNWTSFEKQLSLIDLQMEADMILERIVFDGKVANQFAVTPDQKSVTLSFLDGTNTIYTLTPAGGITQFDSVRGSVFTIAQNIDYNQSSFQSQGNYFNTTLVSVADVLGRRVELNVATQIMPRNLP